MWPFKSKFEKISREDVNDAICKLDAENKVIDEKMLSMQQQIEEVTLLAKRERIREIKLNYIKKISYLKRSRVTLAKRSSYILYNIELMERLKQSIDDNQLFTLTQGITLNKLLSDQKGLRKFLLKSLNTKQTAEKKLVEGNEVFDSVDDLYEESEEIYGKSESDDELLAAFEKEASMHDDTGLLDDIEGKDETDEILSENAERGDK